MIHLVAYLTSALVSASCDSLIQLGLSSFEKTPREGKKYFTQAAEDSEDSLELDPKSYSAALCAGKAYFYLEKDRKARKYIDIAISNNPRSPSAKYFSGVLYKFAGDESQSLAEFNESIRNDSSFGPSWKEVATIYSNRDDYDGAIQAATALLNLDSNDIDGNYIAGISYARKEDFARSIPYFRRVAMRDSNYLELMYNLGVALHLSGALGEATSCFIKALSKAPNDWRVISKLVQTHTSLNDSSSADQYMRKLFELRSRGSIKELRSQNLFVREQFAVGSNKVFGLQYFSPDGENNTILSFNVLDIATGSILYKIVLGSKESTAQVARETGFITAGENLYHLDFFSETEQRLVAMYKNKPGYSKIRDDVIKYIKEIQANNGKR